MEIVLALNLQTLKLVTPKLVQHRDLGLLVHGVAGALALKLVAQEHKAVHAL